jgi:hypothetical protein
VKLASGNWLYAVAGFLVPFYAAVLVLIFSEVPGEVSRQPKTIQRNIVEGICILVFTIASVSLGIKFVQSLFFESANETKEVRPPSGGATSSDKFTPVVNHELVPVEVKLTSKGAWSSQEQLTLYVESEVANFQVKSGEPDRDGIVVWNLPEGNAILTTNVTHGRIKFLVKRPKTELNIKIDLNNTLVETVSKPSDAELIHLYTEKSQWALGDQIQVSLNGISFEGDPLQHLVTFSVGDRRGKHKQYLKQGVGAIVHFERYIITLKEADTFDASLLVAVDETN